MPSFHNKCMETRALYVSAQIIDLLDKIGDKASDEKWDGRELVTGLATAFKQVCVALNINPSEALGLVKAIDAPALSRGISLLAGPDGRPLNAPPRQAPFRLIGGALEKVPG